MPITHYMVLVQDYGEIYEYPYESIEAARGFMQKCSLECTLCACIAGEPREVLCRQAAS